MIQEILRDTANLDRRQALGLCALIFIAQRENSNIYWQYGELDFRDIPVETVHRLDELDQADQLYVAAELSAGFVGAMVSYQRTSR